MVEDDTELTTLTGENGKYHRLVEALFQTDFGSITWGEVRHLTKEEFLDKFLDRYESSGSGMPHPGNRVKLEAWIRYYVLEDRFAVNQQAERERRQKHIFVDGLPELGPISETTKFTSNPSIPTEQEHATAHLQISTFTALSDLEELPFPKTNMWNQVSKKDGTLGGYSTKEDVNSYVRMVIVDILESLDLRDDVKIRNNVQAMNNSPDFMLILVNGHPIGTIKGKQPGKDAMQHPNVLGEIYDELMHLRSIFRVDTPFAILTCYNQWRICWLNEALSMERAGMRKIPERVAYAMPVKRQRSTEHAYKDMSLDDDRKEDSPLLSPTPSRTVGTMGLPEADVAEPDVEDDLGTDFKTRTFCGTHVMERSDRSLPVMLASLIMKMMLARQEDKPTVLRLANATTSAWKNAPLQSADFGLCISGTVKTFFLWEDLGHGADGKAFLVSGGTRGAVGVLKFFFTDPERKAQHEEKMWKAVYSHLPPVAKTVRTVQVMGHTALLMPWFQSPERTQSTLDAVEKTLIQDFKEKGFRHDDVAWRNVGVYRDRLGQTKAVVFDMQKVQRFVEDQEDWVASAVDSLSQKLG